MTAGNNRSYLDCLYKFVHECNNTKTSIFKVGDRFRFTKYKHILRKCYTEEWSKETFVIEFICKTNPWRYRIKHLKGVKVLVVVESLLSKR